jgi:hypothetical protein
MRIIILLVLISGYQARGQVIISLLLGEQLNSGKLEFGLDGGLSLSQLQGVEPSKNLPALNLGFYFDIPLKKPHWYFHTGVMVKSSMGGEKLPVYSLNDAALDAAFEGGSVTRKIGYFNVPFMMKYRFANNFFVEAGPMFSLLANAHDEFIASVKSKEDLTYKLKIKDHYHKLDAGVLAGVGYRLMKGTGMNTGVRYYYGFVDVEINDNTPDQSNRAFYFYVGIPVGAGKAAEKKKNK